MKSTDTRNFLLKNFNYICNVNILIMARQIKETPVLKGKDAVNFIKIMQEPQTPVDEKIRQRMKENFKKLNSIANF